MVKALSKTIEKNNITKYTDETPIIVDKSANLNIVLWGDPQISLLSPYRSARVHSACRDIKNAQGQFDALVMLGDITEYGALCEYKMVSLLLKNTGEKFNRIFAISGNHDIRLRNYKKQLKRFNDFLKNLSNGISGSDEHYYFSSEVNGYKFIFMGADKTAFEASYISEKQLIWLEKEISSADENNPVFIFNHQPLERTNGLPETWLGKGDWRGHIGAQSSKLKKIFENHKNIIYITGHLHFGISRYSYEDYGSFKAISVSTIGVLNHGEYNPHTQGYVLSVYDDKLVARARVFGEGRYVEEKIENSYFEIKMQNELDEKQKDRIKE